MPLTQQPYDNEDLLQRALADYPGLIAGVGTAGGSGRLMLIQREMPVSDSSGAKVMSLDHLFVDEQATPVLVEVKRSSDTRSRREVVAQMLDYAANGTAYWPVDEVRRIVESRLSASARAEYLKTELGIDHEPDAFWRRFADKLQQGHIRLVFLADRLAPELVRIIEFLNEQMHDTEVLGVELPQFRGEEAEEIIYVPRVIGRTAIAVETKRGLNPLGSGEDDFLTQLRDRRSPAEVDAAIDLMDAWRAFGGTFRWGKGATETSCTFAQPGSNANAPIVIYPRGSVEVNFQHFKAYRPFDDLQLQAQFREHIRKVDGIRVDGIDDWPRPAIKLQSLTNRRTRSDFARALEWFNSVLQQDPTSGQRANVMSREADSR